MLKKIRNREDNYYKHFWNDSNKHQDEDTCRNLLLTHLMAAFTPFKGICCQSEAKYAEDKRADIRLFYSGFQVPIEAKGEWHKELRTAAQSQLVRQYASASDANEYGIYLVFWFGGIYMPSFRKKDQKPSTPEALQEMLEAEFKTVSPQRIFVRVLDVTPLSQNA